MGNILIIKNNDKEAKIYENAKDSFESCTKRYYNTTKDSPNEKYLSKIKDKFGKNGLVLLITYDGKSENKIQDVFIGSQVNINDLTNIEYTMQKYLTIEENPRTIMSIVDKIDLDISKDFDWNCYVIMSDMENLYNELCERINSNMKEELPDRKPSLNLDNKSIEGYTLSNLAQKDCQSVRVYSSNELGNDRTEFQRDRERVVNCKAFRRMVDKAQIFSAEKGDYFRTRMTHSLEVNQIAKAIAYALRMNIDLTEAIALGHDLGHTPFGHQGERTLDDILSGNIKAGIKIPENMLKERCFGGFKHNYQSARILTQLEEKYVQFAGLNVSIQVVEGVLKHTELKEDICLDDFLDERYTKFMKLASNIKNECCATLEGQIVFIADEIAQRGHDVDDALTSGVLSIEEFIDRLKVSKCETLKLNIIDEINKVDISQRLIADKKELKITIIVSNIINYMISDTIDNSRKCIKKLNDLKYITMENTQKIIGFSEEVESINSYLERVVQKKVICNSEVARADYNANMIVKTLFEKYYLNPRLLHTGTLHKIFIETLNHKDKRVSNSAVNLNDGSIKIVNEEIRQITQEEIKEKSITNYLKDGLINETEDLIKFEKRKILIRCIVDFIAGMTDGYAIEEFDKLK